MGFKIDDDVPLPKGVRRGYAKTGFVEALRQLQVGQSVWLPCKINSTGWLLGSVQGSKFVSRKDGDGRRFWRVK